MIDSLFTLSCDTCEEAGRLSRLWVRAQIDLGSGLESDGSDSNRSSEVPDASNSSEILNYIECMNCSARFKSRMEDQMEAVDDDEWRRCVEEPTAPSTDPSTAPANSPESPADPR